MGVHAGAGHVNCPDDISADCARKKHARNHRSTVNVHCRQEVNTDATRFQKPDTFRCHQRSIEGAQDKNQCGEAETDPAYNRTIFPTPPSHQMMHPTKERLTASLTSVAIGYRLLSGSFACIAILATDENSAVGGSIGSSGISLPAAS